MQIRYKRCSTKFTEDVRFPVYAGEDGSIVIFRTDRLQWEQLNQSHDKSNGYWVVSIPKAVVDNNKPRLEKDVHVLVCHAWRGDRPSPAHRVDHINGDPDDNSSENLAWIKPLGNATKASLSEKQFPASFSEIKIDCSMLRNGASILDAVAVVMEDGRKATARHLIGHGKGRPPTRISSLLESLYRHDDERHFANCKSDAKLKLEFATAMVSGDGHHPFPDEIVIAKPDR